MRPKGSRPSPVYGQGGTGPAGEGCRYAAPGNSSKGDHAIPPQEMTAVIEHADGLPQPQRKWAILTIALGIIMSVVDGAIANVALPTIAKALNASPAFSIWIVNGYQLAITISLLPMASLGEIIGYR